MEKLICVEDDSGIRELIEYTLSNYGFEVVGCKNATEFFELIEKETANLILLDIMLPDKDGMQVLRQLKESKATENIPVILLTAKSGQLDKIKGLDSGADDYITKPFDIMELISRVKAVIRRTTPKNTCIVSFHGLQINTASREVFSGSEKIQLTYKEFELLSILVSNLNTVQTRDNLMNKVWGIDFEGESRTLDVHIRTLRQKIGDDGKYIETVRNVGYKAV